MKFKLALVVLFAGATLAAQPAELDVVKVRDNVFMIAEAGANITLQFGPDGAVVVDAGTTDAAETVIAAIRQITPQPIRYVIDTSDDADHVGGNEKVAKAGKTLFQTNAQLGEGMTNGGAAAVLSAEKVLTRMSAPTGKAAKYPTAMWPTETYDQKRKYMYLNGEGIEVLHLPAAHTDADSVVFFRRSDVVAAGDVLDLTRFPAIDLARGGSIQGEIDALNRLVELAIPSVPLVSQEGGTLVIPGHGYVCDQLDVVEYRDMVTIVRDRVQDLIRKGMTLEQVKAANPTAGYNSRYGASTAFITSIYESIRRRN
ncbi:MAG TPA: MBL fold metallo-hydrolase [Vicinamibacterales bacterium]|nr:MBL fold metallo-hydrolase [Vicinamibacterales bacterium]